MSIKDNLQNIHEEIAAICQEWQRAPDNVQLLAVSKKQPMDKIQAALDAGQRLFGENRVQEAQDHWRDHKEKYPDLKLHLIGPLQTNKVKDAVALFDVIETVDREKLARKLGDEISRQKSDTKCLIQVNTGDEAQKAGIAPDDLADFYKFCVQDCGLKITGLMCIPPIDEPPALHFALLQKKAQALGLEKLSMGMSSDFQKAIPLGATIIRVGTGVFGVRER